MIQLNIDWRPVLVAQSLLALRRPLDLATVRAAPDPDSFARAALLPAARNLGVAIRLLPAPMRREATAAFLACRVLDAFEDLDAVEGVGAFEDLGVRNDRRQRLLMAVDYLCGQNTQPPAAPLAAGTRESDRLDAVLAERMCDIRQLLLALPPPRRDRIHMLLSGIGSVMARNLEAPLPRDAYARGVLGQVVGYAYDLVTARPLAAPDLCASVGTLTQMANDLRDGECDRYGVATTAELTRHVFLRLPPLVLATFALLADLGTAARSRGARAAAAYMAITTTGFLCRKVGAPPAYPRPARLPAALRAAISRRQYAAVLARVAGSVNGAVAHVVAPRAPGHRGEAALTLLDVGAVRRLATSYRPAELPNLLVGAAFGLIDDLPRGRLTGDLAGSQVLRVMLADQLALGAFDQIGPNRTDRMRELADLIQQSAITGARA